MCVYKQPVVSSVRHLAVDPRPLWADFPPYRCKAKLSVWVITPTWRCSTHINWLNQRGFASFFRVYHLQNLISHLTNLTGLKAGMLKGKSLHMLLITGKVSKNRIHWTAHLIVQPVLVKRLPRCQWWEVTCNCTACAYVGVCTLLEYFLLPTFVHKYLYFLLLTLTNILLTFVFKVFKRYNFCSEKFTCSCCCL